MTLPFFDEEFARAGFEPTMHVEGVIQYRDGGYGVLLEGVVLADEVNAEQVANLMTHRLGFFVLNYFDDDWIPSEGTGLPER